MKKQLQHLKAYCSLYSEKSLTDLSHITLPFNVKFQVQTSSDLYHVLDLAAFRALLNL